MTTAEIKGTLRGSREPKNQNDSHTMQTLRVSVREQKSLNWQILQRLMDHLVKVIKRPEIYLIVWNNCNYLETFQTASTIWDLLHFHTGNLSQLLVGWGNLTNFTQPRLWAFMPITKAKISPKNYKQIYNWLQKWLFFWNEKHEKRMMMTRRGSWRRVGLVSLKGHLQLTSTSLFHFHDTWDDDNDHHLI